MNIKMLKLALAGVVLSVSGFANAGFITSTFTSNTALQIPATGSSGAASEFPTTIEISGLLGDIVDINIFVSGISHTYPDDINIGIVGPTGVSVYLWADAGGSTGIENIDLTFDDEALQAISNGGPMTSGIYQVSQFGDDEETIPASFGSLLSDFDGLSANGFWSLYIWDDAGQDIGSMQGWGIEVTTESVPEPSTLAIFALGIMGLVSRRFKK